MKTRVDRVIDSYCCRVMVCFDQSFISYRPLTQLYHRRSTVALNMLRCWRSTISQPRAKDWSVKGELLGCSRLCPRLPANNLGSCRVDIGAGTAQGPTDPHDAARSGFAAGHPMTWLDKRSRRVEFHEEIVALVPLVSTFDTHGESLVPPFLWWSSGPCCWWSMVLS